MKAGSYHIDDATEYQRIKKVISKKNQPNKIMRFLMNALESYRQARKLGWSRPWNKYDLTVFQTFKLNIAEDNDLITQFANVIENDISMPSSARKFVEELLADKAHLMGFLFAHDYQQEGQQYEGVTFSLGRVKDKRYRDRIDLIFESPVNDGVSQGFSRIRVYIDPFMGVKEPLWSCLVEKDLSAQAQHLFEQLTDVSWTWAEQEDRLWSHWTSDYIDYFGPRQQMLEMSYLYQPELPETRIRLDEEQAA